MTYRHDSSWFIMYIKWTGDILPSTLVQFCPKMIGALGSVFVMPLIHVFFRVLFHSKYFNPSERSYEETEKERQVVQGHRCFNPTWTSGISTCGKLTAASAWYEARTSTRSCTQFQSCSSPKGDCMLLLHLWVSISNVFGLGQRYSLRRLCMCQGWGTASFGRRCWDSKWSKKYLSWSFKKKHIHDRCDLSCPSIGISLSALVVYILELGVSRASSSGLNLPAVSAGVDSNLLGQVARYLYPNVTLVNYKSYQII